MTLNFHISPPLFEALQQAVRETGRNLFVVGGTVRDFLLGRAIADLDLAVDTRAVEFAGRLTRLLPGAVCVLLSRKEDTARVVWQNQVVDLAGFRKESVCIEEDLAKRDFTINAMAVPFGAVTATGPEHALIDPTGGRRDLAARRIHLTAPAALDDDPLRMVRAFRFAAVLDFTVSQECRRNIAEKAAAVATVAGERTHGELDAIMDSGRAFQTVTDMGRHGLLQYILPEVTAGQGVTQPQSHHHDVYHHLLATLSCMEEIVRIPDRFFPDRQEIVTFVAQPRNRLSLLWAALLHDVGKPLVRDVRANGKITFHKHEQQGVALVETIGSRLRWSRERTKKVSHLVALHMRPLHLVNSTAPGEKISRRAAYRLIKAAAEELPGLFLLSLADCLSAKGAEKPDYIEEQLVALYNDLMEQHHLSIQQALTGPPLVTGRDLIELFGLTPGPLFAVLLQEMEKERACGIVSTREQALELLRSRFSTT